MRRWSHLLSGSLAALVMSCQSQPSGGGARPPQNSNSPPADNGPATVPSDIFAPLGEPVPFATSDQRAAFQRGRGVLNRRFELCDGLGPTFNVVSCGACHERPVPGGSAARYRNFFLAGQRLSDGSFVTDDKGGVLRSFDYTPGQPARPATPEGVSVFAQRNPIPLFGVGLIAEIAEAEILAHADPDDSNGDGISGRANMERGFVGRFGRKAQASSIEAFIREQVFNHIGVTTEPLSAEMQNTLPMPRMAEAARTTDADDVPDPELSPQDLFDLVSFTMLLAPAAPDPPTAQTQRGEAFLTSMGCTACHIPTLPSPRGLIPLYSDLLLHDMGPGLADGIDQGEASGAEFRTQPLWNVASVGPYLHDGRADTLKDAILAHGGEAQRARDAYAQLQPLQKDDVVAFLNSLGGADQVSLGLLPPAPTVPGVGEYGGPTRELSFADFQNFFNGRMWFDTDRAFSAGLGRFFNGDSCRACHFDPVIGGAGPRDVNVIRCGIANADGTFVAPTAGTILHKQVAVGPFRQEPQNGVDVYEHRQTPALFGLGLVDRLPDAVILAKADPDDRDGDGTRGRASILPDGRLGRFGWKAQVPSLAEFLRDAMASELGITVQTQAGLSFGAVQDDDAMPDPEFLAGDAETMVFFMENLGPPPRGPISDQVLRGADVFERVGCTKCHTPALTGPDGPVPLYSDLLLHEILPPFQRGIADTAAGERDFRTAPLWGLSRTAPYFHSGEADTIEQAIELHDGEAELARQAYRQLSASDHADLLAFLNSL